MLSTAVFLFSLCRGILLYNIISGKRYEIVEGTCVSVTAKPFRKYSVIKIMDQNAVESTLRLGKEAKVKIGTQYRFYFSGGERVTLGNDYFDSAFTTNQCLGFEEFDETDN